ncbi:hypothetical protein [Halococcus hamelinensis]|uniref:PRC-barrel domain-containing protein n=1 Tax=Halococcus hamelinensis 100A6 TaxID=1132509 RepID=M0M4H0_9EURY|nr:hypothetical protein [Halococcus hamelinensis]EMA39280.1 hypothetical protein C447_07178 [Halococcus hamelinensis 100A6]
MARDFTDDDRGLSVVDHDGNRVGTVDDVRDDTALVDTSGSDSGVLDTVTSALGWNDDDETHELRHDDVETVSDEHVRLRNL